MLNFARTVVGMAALSAAMIGMGSSAARAAQFDAERDMLASQEPAGPQELINPNTVVTQWSYGFRSTTLGPGLTLFTAADHIDSGSLEGFLLPRLTGVVVVVAVVGDSRCWRVGSRGMPSMAAERAAVLRALVRCWVWRLTGVAAGSSASGT